MKTITLNGTKMREKTAALEYLARKFGLDLDVKNLDALYDALGEINESTLINLNSAASSKTASGKMTFRKICLFKKDLLE